MLKNLKNRLDSNKGFTLVELIVVIAIMVILIALLVPNVIGYIASSQKTANLSAAKSIYNAANTCVVNAKASKGNYPTSIQLSNLMNGNVAGNGTEVTTTASDEGKLVTVSTGTAAAIYYIADKGKVVAVMASSVNSGSNSLSGVTAGTNKAVYDPELSGNALESSVTSRKKISSDGSCDATKAGATSTAPVEKITCVNGSTWAKQSS